jgi:hypothetical protein
LPLWFSFSSLRWHTIPGGKVPMAWHVLPTIMYMVSVLSNLSLTPPLSMSPQYHGGEQGVWGLRCSFLSWPGRESVEKESALSLLRCLCSFVYAYWVIAPVLTLAPLLCILVESAMHHQI